MIHEPDNKIAPEKRAHTFYWMTNQAEARRYNRQRAVFGGAGTVREVTY